MKKVTIVVFLCVCTGAWLREVDKKIHPEDLQKDDTPDTMPRLVPKYLLLISELNLDGNGILKNQFIELEARENIYLPPNLEGQNLKGYRLLVVQGDPLQVVISIDLETAIPNLKKSFITLGTKAVKNLDIDLKAENAHSIYVNEDYILPPMDNSPFAVIIMHTSFPEEHEAVDLQNVDGRFVPLLIQDDEWRKDIILKHSLEMVVVGRKVASNGCSFFDAIFPGSSSGKKENYILRDWDTDEAPIKDLSLNRCCDHEVPFSPDCFKLSFLTPGEENDCKTAKTFILEHEIRRIKGRKSTKKPLAGGCESTLSSADPEDLFVDESSFSAVLKATFAQKTDCLKLPTASGTPTSPVGPQTHTHVLPELPQIKIRHFTSTDKLFQSDAINWLSFVDTGTECRFYCHVCREFLRLGYRPDIKIRADIIRKKGSFSKFPATNTLNVRRHEEHKLHQNSMDFYKQILAAKTDEEKKAVIEKQDELERTLYQATMNVIQMAYIELSVGVSFKSHEKFINGLHDMGLAVGKHHRHEKAIGEIAEIIAADFHKILLQSLVDANKPFTLIVDGTTIDNVPYEAVLFQTLEDERPIVYFYALIVLTKGEVSKSMVKDLTDRIAEDDKIVPGFRDYFMAQCMVLASDSASNMVGPHNSFHFHLQKYLRRDISLVKCGAHKLQRILVHALNFTTDEATNDTYFANFASINNKFYTFYMSRGSKRYLDLTKKAEDLGLTPHRIKYHFDVRFAASQYRCMTTLYDQYEALKVDLLERVTDPTFDMEGQNIANTLHRYISDKSFIATLADFVDFLEIFQKMSRNFQLKGGVLIGNVNIVREGYEKLLKLKSEPGDTLSGVFGKGSLPRRM